MGNESKQYLTQRDSSVNQHDILKEAIFHSILLLSPLRVGEHLGKKKKTKNQLRGPILSNLVFPKMCVIGNPENVSFKVTFFLLFGQYLLLE